MLINYQLENKRAKLMIFSICVVSVVSLLTFHLLISACVLIGGQKYGLDRNINFILFVIPRVFLVILAKIIVIATRKLTGQWFRAFNMWMCSLSMGLFIIISDTCAEHQKVPEDHYQQFLSA